MNFINSGRKFELKFIQNIDNHYYCELNSNLKKFILFLFGNPDCKRKICCKKMPGNKKADVYIKYNNTIKYVSLKCGSENSVHVEKLEHFANFLFTLDINKEIIDKLKIYHFGDDTLTGNGTIRYSANEAKFKYKNQIKDFNKFINNYIQLPKIIDRFLFVGTNPYNQKVDAIYYGDIEIGTWCSRKEILDYSIKNKCMHINTPHFSSFVYQNWCRNIYFNNKSESHREYIQIKWFSILSDISKIRNLNK